MSYGDLMAMVGSLNVAERRLTSLIETYGLDTFYAATDDLTRIAEVRVDQLLRLELAIASRRVPHELIAREEPGAAPISRRIIDPRGAACQRASSNIRTPSRTFAMWALEGSLISKE